MLPCHGALILAHWAYMSQVYYYPIIPESKRLTRFIPGVEVHP